MTNFFKLSVTKFIVFNQKLKKKFIYIDEKKVHFQELIENKINTLLEFCKY